MSDDHPQSCNGSSSKSWVEKITDFFNGEPKDRPALSEIINAEDFRDVIDEQTKEMIQGVLDVTDLRVRDIIVPRAQMITIDTEDSLDEILPVILESNHSRFPVVDEDKDTVEGILLAKDLLAYGFKKDAEEVRIADLIRKAMVVPESKKIASLLHEFRQNRYHMAVVIDEYGGISGLVTIEDILEQIVGDIEDEYDAEDDNPENIRSISKNVYSVQGLTPLDEFNEYFKTSFEEADTIAGIIMHAFGHMPSRGESIEINGLDFKVLTTDARRIVNVRVTASRVAVTTQEENNS